MRTISLALAFGSLLLVGACGDTTTSNSGDMAQSNTNPDLTPTNNPDLTNNTNPHMIVGWDVYGRNTMDSTMMAMNCDDPLAKITTLAFDVFNAAGTHVMTSSPCTKGTNFGDATIGVPDTMGDFGMTITPDGGKADVTMHPDFDIGFTDHGFVAHIIVPTT